MAHLVGKPTLGFGSGHDLGVLGSSPSLGSSLSGESEISPPFSLFFCPSPFVLMTGMSLLHPFLDEKKNGTLWLNK